MKITRVSPLTGKMNTLELDVTQDQLDELDRPGYARRLIQDIFPNLSNVEREFLKTGYTQEDWDTLFSPQDGPELQYDEEYGESPDDRRDEGATE